MAPVVFGTTFETAVTTNGDRGSRLARGWIVDVADIARAADQFGPGRITTVTASTATRARVDAETMDPRPRVILVADDEQDLRRLVVRRLQRAGYDVVEAGDGESAWTLAADRRPDVAVLDVRMPGLDGYALTRRIRADEATREMGVILLTASAQEHEEQTGRDAGADRYMHKPFVPADLLGAVEELCRQRGTDEPE